MKPESRNPDPKPETRNPQALTYLTPYIPHPEVDLQVLAVLEIEVAIDPLAKILRHLGHFGFRVSGVGSRVLDFGFRVSVFGCRVSNFGCRVSSGCGF